MLQAYVLQAGGQRMCVFAWARLHMITLLMQGLVGRSRGEGVMDAGSGGKFCAPQAGAFPRAVNARGTNSSMPQRKPMNVCLEYRVQRTIKVAGKQAFGGADADGP